MKYMTLLELTCMILSILSTKEATNLLYLCEFNPGKTSYTISHLSILILFFQQCLEFQLVPPFTFCDRTM